MKKYHLYLWIVALVGLMTACSQDEAAGPQNEASHRVRIGTSINQALQTRAASVNIPDHQLRYVLEVWSTGESPACIHRDEKTATTAGAVTFDFTLADVGNYKALLWADFVSTSASTNTVNTPNTYTHYQDLHYTTNSTTGLKAVELHKTDGGYVINDEARDAFFACITIKKETGAFEESVELTRPFGQINVIEKSTDLLSKVASMTLEYDVPNKFDVETGLPSGTAVVRPTVSTLPTATAARKANLFYDFIFTPATGQTTLGEIKLTFTDNDAAINLDKFTIPANMPAVRNKRTNISGSILHTSIAPSDAAKLSVTISDGWEATTEEHDIDIIAKTVLDAAKTAGSGDDDSQYSYTITTAEQLAALATLTNADAVITGSTNAKYSGANYNLGNNIVLSYDSWTPIGTNTSPFKGTLEGNGYHISNLKVNVSTANAGLFGYLSGSKVSNMRVSGNVKTSGSYAGGIAGYNDEGSTIENCIFNGDVKGGSYVGGIAGMNNGDNSQIAGCYTQGNVTATNSYAGGIVGENKGIGEGGVMAPPPPSKIATAKRKSR